jgi:hypothetical protein
MRDDNHAENPHLVIRKRERKQQKFKSEGSAQRFLSSHGPIYNAFNLLVLLTSRVVLRTLRAEANGVWAAATRAACSGTGRAFCGLNDLICPFQHEGYSGDDPPGFCRQALVRFDERKAARDRRAQS